MTKLVWIRKYVFLPPVTGNALQLPLRKTLLPSPFRSTYIHTCWSITQHFALVLCIYWHISGLHAYCLGSSYWREGHTVIFLGDFWGSWRGISHPCRDVRWRCISPHFHFLVPDWPVACESTHGNVISSSKKRSIFFIILLFLYILPCMIYNFDSSWG